MSRHAPARLTLPILTLASLTVRAQDAAVPACARASLADYSKLECTVNNLDFKFDEVTFARNPDPKTVQVEPVSNPDGLRVTLPAIPKSDDDSADLDAES